MNKKQICVLLGICILVTGCSLKSAVNSIDSPDLSGALLEEPPSFEGVSTLISDDFEDESASIFETANETEETVTTEEDIKEIKPNKLKLYVGEIDITPLVKGPNYRPKYKIDEGREEESSESEESETIGEGTTAFDAEMEETLGVSAPVIDDWFPYVRNEFIQFDNVWKLVEVGKSDKSKIITILISNKPIERNDEREMIEDTINDKDVSISFNEESNNIAIWKCDEINYNMETENVSTQEFKEILEYIVDLTR